MNYLTRNLTYIMVSIFILAGMETSSFAQQSEERADLAKIFDDHNTVGTFALYAPAKDHLILVNANRATMPMIPASTFKIANALIALETGVISSEHEVIPYGGKPQPFKSWERDMPMGAAIKISNVPVFQELARRIGIVRYQKWLARLNYGNGNVGEKVETFWLDGPLMISAVEQVKFLANLAQTKLPSSKRLQETVADIIRLERKGDRILYGKTGWTIAPSPQLGWFVGWVENERGIFSFALNMDMNSKSDARKRKRIAKSFLDELGIY